MAEGHFPDCKLIDDCGYMDFTWQMYLRGEQSTLAGAGNVIGPASAIGGHVVLFADATGTLLLDGGLLGSAAFTPASAYQVTLVSGTNIKTINGTSVLGAGDLAVAGATGPQGPTGAILFMEGETGDDGMMVPGQKGADGASGPAGVSNMPGPQGMDGFDGDDGMSIPGIPGTTGAQGTTGITGASGVTVIGLDGTDGDEGMLIPGTPGTSGATGAQGSTGFTGPSGMDGADGDDGVMVQGSPSPAGATGNVGPQGVAGIMFNPFSQIPLSCSPQLRLALLLSQRAVPFLPNRSNFR